MADNDSLSQQPGRIQIIPEIPAVWSAEENQKYEEVVTALWTTEQAKSGDSRLIGAELWARVSQQLLEKSVLMTAEQCRQKIAKLRKSKAEYQNMFLFRQANPRIEQPSPKTNNTENDIYRSFVEHGDSNVSDENMPSDPMDRKYKWSNEELDKLISLVVARRELEDKDKTVQVLSAKEIWEFVSVQLKEYSIHRSSDSCKSYWMRDVAGYFGFGTDAGLEATKRSPTTASNISLSAEQLSVNINPKLMSNGKFRFSEEQKEALEVAFRKSPSLNNKTRDQLAQELNVTSIQVSGWFSHARKRERIERKRQSSSGDKSFVEESILLFEASRDNAFTDENATPHKRKASRNTQTSNGKKKKSSNSVATVDSDDEPLITKGIPTRASGAKPNHKEKEKEKPFERFQPARMKRKAPANSTCPVPASSGFSSPASAINFPPLKRHFTAGAGGSDVLSSKIRNLDNQILSLNEKAQSRLWEITASNTEIESLERQIKTLSSERDRTRQSRADKKAELLAHRAKIEELGVQKKTILNALEILKAI